VFTCHTPKIVNVQHNSISIAKMETLSHTSRCLDNDIGASSAAVGPHLLSCARSHGLISTVIDASIYDSIQGWKKPRFLEKVFRFLFF